MDPDDVVRVKTRDFRSAMAELPRHQRVIISLSVHILRAAMARAGEARVDVVEVRLPLRCLLPHCAERWPLELFWGSAAQRMKLDARRGPLRRLTG
jgi:F420-0:gamma-glutamyl ligase-like protein